MAQDFSSSTSLLNCGNLNSIGTPPAITVITVCQVDSVAGKFYQKGLAGATAAVADLVTATSRTSCAMGAAIASADLAAFTAYALGRPLVVAHMTDTVVSENNRILIGNLGQLAAEPSTYIAQSSGAGNTWGGGIAWIVGNKSNNNSAFDGWHAFQALWPRILSTDEVHAVQRMFMPGRQRMDPSVVPGHHLWVYPGFKTLTTRQPDWSGFNNHGAVTGSTLVGTGALLVREPGWRSGALRRKWLDVPAAAAPSTARWFFQQQMLRGRRVA